MDREDSRLVQTAVLGGPDSWDPAILPTERGDAQRLVGRFKSSGLWCGNLLGGCGQKLTTKIGRIRIPHFSHFPDPTGEALCARRSTGRASADHLFINRDFTAWLTEHGTRLDDPEFHGDMHSKTGCTGVDVRARNGTGAIAVALSDSRSWFWRAHDDQLRHSHPWVTWVFGGGVVMPADLLERDGFVLRVRCKDNGLTRTIEVGTQMPHAHTEWVELSDCRLTPAGLLTPHAAELRDERARRGTGASPVKPQPIRDVIPQQELHKQIGTLLQEAFTACYSRETKTARALYDKAARLVADGRIDDGQLLTRLHNCKDLIDSLAAASVRPMTPSARRLRETGPATAAPRRSSGNAPRSFHAENEDRELRLENVLREMDHLRQARDIARMKALVAEAERILRDFPVNQLTYTRQRVEEQKQWLTRVHAMLSGPQRRLPVIGDPRRSEQFQKHLSPAQREIWINLSNKINSMSVARADGETLRVRSLYADITYLAAKLPREPQEHVVKAIRSYRSWLNQKSAAISQPPVKAKKKKEKTRGSPRA